VAEQEEPNEESAGEDTCRHGCPDVPRPSVATVTR
jgi:hypothetical protein